MWAKYILLIGIIVALTMSVVVTLPYVFAWSSYRALSTEMNVVALKGTAYSRVLPTTVANISIVAIYPKSVVYSDGGSTAFNIQLVFFVQLDPRVYYFSGDGGVQSYPWGGSNPTFSGTIPNNYSSVLRDQGTLFDRQSDSGHIPSFFVNYSIPIYGSYESLPNTPNFLYFVGVYQVYPEIALNGGVGLSNGTSGSVDFGFLVNDHPIAIYCLNYPLTLWIAYMSSGIITVFVSTNYLLSRKHARQSALPAQAP
jgi:hypothetical protein